MQGQSIGSRSPRRDSEARLHGAVWAVCHALANAIGVDSTHIDDIVDLRRGITAETALGLARYFNTDAQSWMNLQTRYELALAERAAADALRAIRPREVA